MGEAADWRCRAPDGAHGTSLAEYILITSPTPLTPMGAEGRFQSEATVLRCASPAGAGHARSRLCPSITAETSGAPDLSPAPPDRWPCAARRRCAWMGIGRVGVGGRQPQPPSPQGNRCCCLTPQPRGNCCRCLTPPPPPPPPPPPNACVGEACCAADGGSGGAPGPPAESATGCLHSPSKTCAAAAASRPRAATRTGTRISERSRRPPLALERRLGAGCPGGDADGDAGRDSDIGAERRPPLALERRLGDGRPGGDADGDAGRDSDLGAERRPPLALERRSPLAAAATRSRRPAPRGPARAPSLTALPALAVVPPPLLPPRHFLPPSLPPFPSPPLLFPPPLLHLTLPLPPSPLPHPAITAAPLSSKNRPAARADAPTGSAGDGVRRRRPRRRPCGQKGQSAGGLSCACLDSSRSLHREKKHHATKRVRQPGAGRGQAGGRERLTGQAFLRLPRCSALRRPQAQTAERW